MSNHVQASNRSLSQYLSRLKKLTQQLEELQELRAQVRIAEARLGGAVRHKRISKKRLILPRSAPQSCATIMR
jgi:prefoldin subunit 5